MFNLMRSNLDRMKKSASFWVISAGIFLFGSLMYILAGINYKKYGAAWFGDMFNNYFFLPMLYIGAALAVFCALFNGTDYACGTIRNKLTVGHKKLSIYIANTVTAIIAGTFFMLSHILSAVIFGLSGLGSSTFTGIKKPVLGIICSMAVILVFSAIFTAISMLISDKTAALIVGVVIFVAAILAPGLTVYARLSQPEYIQRMTSEDLQTFQPETVKNPAYLEPDVRKEYLFAEKFLPMAVSLEITDPESNLTSAYFWTQLLIFGAVTSAGVSLFIRKDIK